MSNDDDLKQIIILPADHPNITTRSEPPVRRDDAPIQIPDPPDEPTE